MNFNRKQLLEKLKDYRSILNNTTMDYLESLIDLESSVCRNRELSLIEINLFKRIARYNIYNRAISLVKEDESDISIKDDVHGLRITTNMSENHLPIFTLDTKFSAYENMLNKAGNICLYQIFIDKELREIQISDIKTKMLDLYEKTIVFNENDKTYAIPEYNSIRNNFKLINKYKEQISYLEKRDDIDEITRKELDLVNKYHDLFLEDYGLDLCEFDECINQRIFEYIDKNDFSHLEKNLIKQLPGVDVYNNIRYY